MTRTNRCDMEPVSKFNWARPARVPVTQCAKALKTAGCRQELQQ